MRIGLIAMSGVRVANPKLAALGVTLPGFVRRGRLVAALPSLGLLTVAGMTPADHDVSYLEVAQLRDVASLPEFDLVGISSLSAQIDEAYAVADQYRSRVTPVVMGGLHVSQLPAEALAHCDSVVIGGAEGIWSTVISDADRKVLKKRYFGPTADVFSPTLYTAPRFDFLSERPYNRVTIQTSRGCPRDCDFCAASRLITPQFVQKPVQLVINEIRDARQYVPHPFFEFADDNTFLNKNWSREFLTALREEGIRWFTETDVSVANDPALCDLLAEAGCRQLLIGFESPIASDLEGLDPANWKRQQAPIYRRAIDALQSRDISVNGCFILGLDTHTPDTFPAVRDFVEESGLMESQFTVLTPFPGTSLYNRLRREGRLLKERFWQECTLFDVTYRPARMSVEELESGLRWLFTEIYSNQNKNPLSRGLQIGESD